MEYKTASDKDQLVQLVLDYCEEAGITSDKKSVEATVDFQLKNSIVYVAIDENKVVGVISFIIITNPFNKNEKLGRKTNSYVKPEYRQQGVGYKLLALAEAHCKANSCTKFFYSGTAQPKDYKIFEIDYVKELN